MPPLTRNNAIKELVDQVADHQFRHLFRNRPTRNEGLGWRGGLSIYSTNNQTAPDPTGHFGWLDRILNRVANLANPPVPADLVARANEVLAWGGMRLRFNANVPASLNVLQAVVASAQTGVAQPGAIMNSSMTKVAAVFGFGNGLNTVWDSRVSTALCFRLACIFRANGDTAATARAEFSDLGYIPGMSQRAIARLPLVSAFWPNVYTQWSGHFAGAAVIAEIARRLNANRVPCPAFGNGQGAGNWTPWKVNMVLFMDDIIDCPAQSTNRGAMNPKVGRQKKGGVSTSTLLGATSFCNHELVNRIGGIHFEPECIRGSLNDARLLGLAPGEHGLQDYRLLLEFYRKGSGNCKISARVRQSDPCFDKLCEAADEAGCPPKKGGIDPADSTCSIFVFPLGKVAKGGEEACIREFTCSPKPEYSQFLSLLPQAMAVQ